MENQLSNLIKKPIVVYFMLFATLFMIHLPMTYFGDDLYFKNAAQSTNWVSFLQMRYNTWSSRVLLEWLTLLSFSLPMWVWKLLNTSIFVLTAYSLNALLNPKKDPNVLWGSSLLVLAYPIFHLATAGWVTTSINYIWPLALGLYAVASCIQQMRIDRAPTAGQIISCGIGLLIACNHEMIAITVLLISGLLLYYAIHKKLNTIMLSVYLGIAMASIAFILRSPCVTIRMQSEISTWFPAFNDFSIADKFIIGLHSTLKHFLGLPSVLFLVLVVSQVKKAYEDRKHILVSKAIASIVALFNIYGMWRLYMELFKPRENKFYQVLDRFYGIKEITHRIEIYQPLYLLELFVMVVFFVGVAYLVIKQAENKVVGWTMLGILAITFGVRVAMGLSPTIYASSVRTFLFPYIGLMVVSLYYMTQLRLSKWTLKRKGLWAAVWLGLASLNIATVLLVEFIKR